MTDSNTQSKLGHSSAAANPQAGAQYFAGSSDGNPSSIQGASNPSIGGGQKHADGPAQEIAGTLPTDFTLKGMKAEYKGEDKTVDNPIQGESLSTLGSGGDKRHPALQSHEVDLPDTPDRSRPSENTGDNQKYSASQNVNN